MSKWKINSDFLLLVEGKDEVNLLEGLIKFHFGENSPIQILDFGGITQFPKNIEAISSLAKSHPTLQSIGVIRDADDDPKAALTSVKYHLTKVGYDVPNSHNVFSSGKPSIGIFIVPDCKNKGAVETLCRLSVKGDKISNCVEQYLKCLELQGELKSSNPDKSYVHAYLAATKNPVARVGEGAKQGVWDFTSPAFQELVSFVRGLDVNENNFSIED